MTGTLQVIFPVNGSNVQVGQMWQFSLPVHGSSVQLGGISDCWGWSASDGLESAAAAATTNTRAMLFIGTSERLQEVSADGFAPIMLKES